MAILGEIARRVKLTAIDVDEVPLNNPVKLSVIRNVCTR